MSHGPTESRRRHLLPLAILLVLFLFRVVAQLVQAVHPVAFLPPFETWQSGALPYRWLFVSQLLIIGLAARVLVRLQSGAEIASRRRGIWLFAIGGIYLAVMLVRVGAAFTVAAGQPWWGAKLPAIFHVILASFLLVLGHFHFTGGDAKQD